MRIATWNVNGIRARLDFLRTWLRDRRPDVVGLQELKVTDDQFPHQELRAEGYEAVTHGQAGWNGVAILSRTPAELRQHGLPGKVAAGARFVTATVGDFDFTTVYVPNGKAVANEDFPRKLEWLDALVQHLASRVSGSAVVCGDFNVCPEALDTWDEATLRGTLFHTDDERRRFRRLVDLGLRDLFRERHPERQAFSWWDYRGGAFHRGFGLRIDFLLGTKDLLERLRSIEIDRDYRKKKGDLVPSDHAPVFADLA